MLEVIWHWSFRNPLFSTLWLYTLLSNDKLWDPSDSCSFFVSENLSQTKLFVYFWRFLKHRIDFPRVSIYGWCQIRSNKDQIPECTDSNSNPFENRKRKVHEQLDSNDLLKTLFTKLLQNPLEIQFIETQISVHSFFFRPISRWPIFKRFWIQADVHALSCRGNKF